VRQGLSFTSAGGGATWRLGPAPASQPNAPSGRLAGATTTERRGGGGGTGGHRARAEVRVRKLNAARHEDAGRGAERAGEEEVSPAAARAAPGRVAILTYTTRLEMIRFIP
jgi:hypothetical protein